MIAYIGCERTATTVMLIVSVIICGAIFVGHLTNHNDLAPNYAGILMGITNTPGTISAFLLPAMVGALTAKGVSLLFSYRGHRNRCLCYSSLNLVAIYLRVPIVLKISKISSIPKIQRVFGN